MRRARASSCEAACDCAVGGQQLYDNAGPVGRECANRALRD